MKFGKEKTKNNDMTHCYVHMLKTLKSLNHHELSNQTTQPSSGKRRNTTPLPNDNASNSYTQPTKRVRAECSDRSIENKLGTEGLTVREQLGEGDDLCGVEAIALSK